MMFCKSSFCEAHARVFEPNGVQREQRHVRDPDEEVKEKPRFRLPIFVVVYVVPLRIYYI